jgi:membrane protease YdiL (CAAX protease family)
VAGKPHREQFHFSTNAQVPWRTFDVFTAFFLAFILAPFTVSALLFPIHPPPTMTVRLLLTHFAIYTAWIGIFIHFRRRFGPSLWRYLGLAVDRNPLSYLADGFVCTGFILLMGFLLGGVSDKLGLPHPHPFTRFSREELKVVSVLAVFTAPFLEEIVFRGFFQPTLYRIVSVPFAIFLTGCFFALFHVMYYGQWMALVYVAMLGMILGVFRYTSRSTIPCIIAHLLNNLIVSLILLHQPL